MSQALEKMKQALQSLGGKLGRGGRGLAGGVAGGLGQAAGIRLHGISEANSPLRSVAQKPVEH